MSTSGRELPEGLIEIVATPTRLSEYVEALREIRDELDPIVDLYHPVEYKVDRTPFARCPACEQWSPCSVRLARDRLAALLSREESDGT